MFQPFWPPNGAKILKAVLETRHTHICGTVRPNRVGMPKSQMNDENLERGEIVHFLHEDKMLLAVKYREARDRANGQSKIVHMLSTMHNSSTVD